MASLHPYCMANKTLFIMYAIEPPPIVRLPNLRCPSTHRGESNSPHEHGMMRESRLCGRSPRCQVVRVLLLQGGADPSIGDRHGQTPLQIAQEEGHDECVQLIQVRQRPSGPSLSHMKHTTQRPQTSEPVKQMPRCQTPSAGWLLRVNAWDAKG